ncbi:MAG: cytochrome c maturation protein CcmE [Candidatus Kapaibacterium sp.]
MKPKYLIGIIAALALIATAVLSVQNKKIEYMDFARAEQTGSKAQIAGTYVKEKGNTYDPVANQFKFCLRDDQGTVMPVVLDGSKPNNFELAQSVVVTGAVEHGQLHATNILTKCPSKYDGGGIEKKHLPEGNS